MIDWEQLRTQLHSLGVIQRGELSYSPMTGGVSSDIWLLQVGNKRLVVKQALPELLVEDDWKADVSRNLAEQDFIKWIAGWNPEAVPDIVYVDRDVPYFVMEYLGPPLQNWKELLLQGNFDLSYTRRAAMLLASIHSRSRNNKQLAQQFNHHQLFYELRIEPYLVTTGRRSPKLNSLYKEEAQRLGESRIALMHGDFSPKNILVSHDRMILLDHEVACFGEPAFDIAFFINHLVLKSILHFHIKGNFDLPLVAWKQYFDLVSNGDPELERRGLRLLMMLMLARVDGKSPVEYLAPLHQKFIREFVHQYLPDWMSLDFTTLLSLLNDALTANEN